MTACAEIKATVELATGVAGSSAEARRHLRSCEECQLVYQRAVTFTRLVAGVAPSDAAPMDKSRGVDEVLPEETRAKGAPWVVLLTAFATAAAMLIFAITPDLFRTPELPTWKGAGWAVPSAIELNALCVTPGEGVGPISSGQTCSSGSVVALVYSSHSPTLGFARVFAVDAHGDVHNLAPAESEGVAVPIGAGDVGFRIGRQLEVDELPLGPLRIVGLFGPSVRELRAVNPSDSPPDPQALRDLSVIEIDVVLTAKDSR